MNKGRPIGDYNLQILGKLANDTAYGPKFKENVRQRRLNETNVNYIVSKIALEKPMPHCLQNGCDRRDGRK
jgi:hypothetical protein